MSEQVRRYKVWEADLVLPDDSEVVLASDYAALQAEGERLREAGSVDVFLTLTSEIAALRAQLAVVNPQLTTEPATAS